MKLYLILFLILDTVKVQIIGAIRKVLPSVPTNVLIFFLSLLATWDTLGDSLGAVAQRDSIRQRSKQGCLNLFSCNLP